MQSPIILILRGDVVSWAELLTPTEIVILPAPGCAPPQVLLFVPDGGDAMAAGLALVWGWANETVFSDGLVSGVLADWIEDHAFLWPGVSVDPFVVVLRARFTNRANNVRGHR